MGPDTTAANNFVELPETAREMALAARAFLDSLEPAQEKRCTFQVDEEERLRWDYRPVPRGGLPFDEMGSDQKYRALALLAGGLSRRGVITALNIMSLERVLGSLEGVQGRQRRDPECYFVSIFGAPMTGSPWGWRLEGHHLSLNFLIVEDRYISCCPQFFGANPALVPSGPHKGLATLAREEECARGLLRMLDGNQRRAAVIAAEAPADIVTNWATRVSLDDPIGLAYSEMRGNQHRVMMHLLKVYLGRMAPHIADAEMELLDREGLASLHFAWAGSARPGEAHYYRLHGPSLVVEYDNVQNNANHIHSVWRSLRRDWGTDLLRAHYAQAHSQ